MAARPDTNVPTGWIDINAPAAYQDLFRAYSVVEPETDPRLWHNGWYSRVSDLVPLLQKTLDTAELRGFLCTVDDLVAQLRRPVDNNSPLSRAVHALSEDEQALLEACGQNGRFPFPTRGGVLFQTDCSLDNVDQFTVLLSSDQGFDEEEARERQALVREMDDEDELQPNEQAPAKRARVDDDQQPQPPQPQPQPQISPAMATWLELYERSTSSDEKKKISGPVWAFMCSALSRVALVGDGAAAFSTRMHTLAAFHKANCLMADEDIGRALRDVEYRRQSRHCTKYHLFNRLSLFTVFLSCRSRVPPNLFELRQMPFLTTHDVPDSTPYWNAVKKLIQHC